MRNAQFALIEGRVLARALKTVLPIVENWSTYPALSSVHLKVNGGALAVTGSNLDVEITAHIDLNDAAGDWASVVSPRVLVKLAGMAGRELVRLSPEDEKLVFEQEGVLAFDLAAIEPDAFPWIEGDTGDVIEAFEADKLQQLLGKVGSYVSTEETRYYLNGVAWQFDGKGRRFVGTDGHRLGLVRYRHEPMGVASRIIPNAAVQLLRACHGEMVVRNVAPLVLQFDGTERRIRTKLIDGEFPDVDRVIPKSSIGELKVGRDVLMQATTRAMALNVRDTFGKAMRFEPDGERTSIGTKHQGFGVGKVALRAAWPEGVAPFGVNGLYLNSVLAGCAGEVRLIASGNDGGPLFIVDRDETMTRLLMPMKA